jgi:SAM-dependent methyltransferase
MFAASRILGRIRREFFPMKDQFDLQIGCDTSILVSPRHLRLHGERYRGVKPPVFRQAVGHLPSELSLLTFVDLGCGKGRALVLAWQSGFRKLVGVEPSRRLCRTAERNLGHIGANGHVATCDARAFRFPKGPLAVFMFNPFGPDVMLPVTENLGRHGGPAYVIYVAPRHSNELTSRIPLRSVAVTADYGVFSL